MTGDPQARLAQLEATHAHLLGQIMLQKDEVEQARRSRGEMEERCRALVAEAQAEAEQCRKQRDESVASYEKEKKERIKLSEKVERRDATIQSLQSRVTSLEQERESLRDTLHKVRTNEEKLLCQLSGKPYLGGSETPDPSTLTPRAALIYQLKDQIASLEADKKRIHEAHLATTLENAELIEELDRQTTGHQEVLVKNQEQAAEMGHLNQTISKLANMLTEYLKQIQQAQKAQREAEAKAQGLVLTDEEPAPLPTSAVELAQKYHGEYVALHKYLQSQLSARHELENEVIRLAERLQTREENGGALAEQLNEYMELCGRLEKNEAELLQQHEQLQNRVEVLEDEKKSLVEQLASFSTAEQTLQEVSVALSEQNQLLDDLQSHWNKKEQKLLAEIKSLKGGNAPSANGGKTEDSNKPVVLHVQPASAY